MKPVVAVGVGGAGRACRILFSALRKCRAEVDYAVYFWTRSAEKTAAVEKEFPGFQQAEIASIFAKCNIIYLGVPPKAIPVILQPLCESSRLSGKLVFSLSPELSQQALNEIIPDAHVIRILHNLPCQVGKGIIVAYRQDRERDDVFQQACNHLSIYGNVVVVQDERLLVESIPLLCLPAVLLKALEELEDAVADSCPDLPNVRAMFRRTIIGVGAWLEMLTEDYETGVNLVATPGGLTEKAVHHVEGNIKGLIDAFQLELEAVRELTR